MTFKQGKKKFPNHKVDNVYCDIGIELYNLKIFTKNDYWAAGNVSVKQENMTNHIIDYLNNRYDL